MRWFKTVAAVIVMTLCATTVLLAQDSTVVVPPEGMEENLVDLMSWLSATGVAFLGALILGSVKKIQGVVDSAWWKLIKPVQPYVLMAATFENTWAERELRMMWPDT